jgi:glyoxylase-like metal-dependent hydrolase (beta-lactamase superfamily II)
MEHLSFGPVRVYPGHQNGKYPDGNQVIVQGADTRVAFDTPLVARHIGADLDGVDLVLLGHVHEDHTVALGRLRAARVQVHEADLAAAQSWDGMARHFGYAPAAMAEAREILERHFDYAPRPDATGYADGAAWDLGGGVRVRAHHLPGHTAGHCALVVESEGIAFIGDIDLSGFGPYYGDACSDLTQFQRSLERVKDIDARVWVTSHHRGALTNRADFLQALARFASRIDARNDKLLGYLRERPHTLDELVERRLLYPPELASPSLDGVERRSIGQPLAQLQQQGAVRVPGAGRYVLA